MRVRSRVVGSNDAFVGGLDGACRVADWRQGGESKQSMRYAPLVSRLGFRAGLRELAYITSSLRVHS